MIYVYETGSCFIVSTVSTRSTIIEKLQSWASKRSRYMPKAPAIQYWRTRNRKPKSRSRRFDLFGNSAPKEFMMTPIHFCVQISWKSSAGKWVKRCVVLVTKTFAKCVFFAAILRPFSGGRQKFAGSMPRDSTSPYKISLLSVPVYPVADPGGCGGCGRIPLSSDKKFLNDNILGIVEKRRIRPGCRLAS